MITIKSSFSRCDVNELKNEYMKLLPDGFDIKSESAAFDAWFEKIMHIEPKSCTDKVLIPYTAHYSMGYIEDVYMDVGYVMQKELRGMIPVPDGTVLKDSTAASRIKKRWIVFLFQRYMHLNSVHGRKCSVFLYQSSFCPGLALKRLWLVWQMNLHFLVMKKKMPGKKRKYLKKQF